MEEQFSRFRGKHHVDLKKDRSALARIKTAAENCKNVLSSRMSSRVRIPAACVIDGKPEEIDETISREFFENLTKDLLEKTHAPWNRCSGTRGSERRISTTSFLWTDPPGCPWLPGISGNFSEKNRSARFIRITDCQLCLLMKRAQDSGKAEIIRKHYPELAEEYPELMDALGEENPEQYIKKPEWEFEKLSERYTGARYDKLTGLAPAEKKKKKKDPEPLFIGDEEELFPEEQPFVRETDKIGRNDPCPCGSGKKFKKCCMGKGVKCCMGKGVYD